MQKETLIGSFSQAGNARPIYPRSNFSRLLHLSNTLLLKAVIETKIGDFL